MIHKHVTTYMHNHYVKREYEWNRLEWNRDNGNILEIVVNASISGKKQTLEDIKYDMILLSPKQMKKKNIKKRRKSIYFFKVGR